MVRKGTNHTHPIKDEHGFSLLELVVSVGVVLVLIMVGVLSYNNISGSAKQSAVQKAANEVYDKAFSALLDGDAETKPEDVAEEYNKSSKNIVATVDVLPAGRIKVTATLGDDYSAVRETPVSAGSDGNSPIDQPTDGTISSNTHKTIMNFQCDDNVEEGFLPIVNMPESGKATLVNVSTNEEKVLNNIENSTNEKHVSYDQSPQNVLPFVKMDAGVLYQLTVEAEVDSATSPFDPETSFAIMSLHEYSSLKEGTTKCLTSIDSIGNGIAGISTHYASKLERVPSTIPSTVTSLKHAFNNARAFNWDISGWNVSNVTDMSHMFEMAFKFDQDISSWDVSNVTDMSHMFGYAQAFDNGGQPLTWNEKTANVTNMYRMFADTPIFNRDISDWDVSNVTDMSHMFFFATAFNNGNQPLTWNEKTAKVTNMSSMFYGAYKFNQDISDWNVSNVTNMSNMFVSARVFNNANQPLTWNEKTANVTNMSGMFLRAYNFNQDISGWDVSNVKDMSYMFSQTKAFNQDISDWNVSNVTDMSFMFANAEAFDQDISGWKPKIADTPPSFATGSGIQSNEQYHPQWGVA